MAGIKLRHALWALLLAGALPGAALAAPRPAVHTIVIDGMLFVPAALTVNAGDTVVWKNKDPFPHTATSSTKGFDSRDIAPTRSWQFVAGRRGAFAYLCTLHPTMKGTLTVK
jgi:plastocyanin